MRLKSSSHKGVRIAVAGVLLLLSGFSAFPQEQCDAKSLPGTWRVQVKLHKCDAAAHGQPFWSLLAFAPGGIVTETTANPAFQPGQRSTGLGIWTRTGEDTYHAVSEAFVLFDSEAHPPVPGFVRGMQRITQEIAMKNDREFSSSASVEFLDESGNVVMAACADAVGYRLK